MAALIRHDEVLLRLEPAAATLGVTEEQPVEMEHVRHGQSLELGCPRDLVHRVSIPCELALVAVAEAPRFSPLRDEPLDPAGTDDDALDRARGRDRFHAGRLGQRVEELRQLVSVQALAAAADVDSRQAHSEAHGLGPERPVEVDEAAHSGSSRLIGYWSASLMSIICNYPI